MDNSRSGGNGPSAVRAHECLIRDSLLAEWAPVRAHGLRRQYSTGSRGLSKDMGQAMATNNGSRLDPASAGRAESSFGLGEGALQVPPTVSANDGLFLDLFCTIWALLQELIPAADLARLGATSCRSRLAARPGQRVPSGSRHRKIPRRFGPLRSATFLGRRRARGRLDERAGDGRLEPPRGRLLAPPWRPHPLPDRRLRVPLRRGGLDEPAGDRGPVDCSCPASPGHVNPPCGE